MRRLFIAEKPSLAEALALGLSAQSGSEVIKRNGEFTVGSDTLIPAAGHLLEAAEPHIYNAAYEKWELVHLPIVPSKWVMLPRGGKDPDEVEKAKRKLARIEAELSRCDVVVHAGDNDVEGQLIVDELLNYFGNTKPVHRVTVNDYHPDAVAFELANLKDNANSQFQGWSKRALARSKFDWLYGMNLTRAATLSARKIGYLAVIPVGRVQTPTLAIVVQRDAIIENFKPVPFFKLTGAFQHKNGEFSARWVMPADYEGTDSEGRLIDRAIAERKAAELSAQGNAFVQTYTTTAKHTKAPLLLDQSALLKAANAAYGYGAEQVLALSQSLYEKHKLTTYPRGDSRHISEEQHGCAEDIAAALIANDEGYAKYGHDADWSRVSRAVDSSKCTVHHAIIPTSTRTDLSALSEPERNIYDLVARSFLAQFLPEYQYMETEVEVGLGGDVFAVKGKTMVAMGWKIVVSAEENEGDGSDEEKPNIPNMAVGDSFDQTIIDVQSLATKPPKRFTEASLEEAMKEVHRFVTNAAIKARLKEGKGIGTPATRAATIGDLIKRALIVPQKAGSKYVISTKNARAIITALPPLCVDPGLTALCEQGLDEVQAGNNTVDEFLAKQLQVIGKLIDGLKSTKLNLPPSPSCPQCKTGFLFRVVKDNSFWSCTNFRSEPKCQATYKDDEGKVGQLTVKNSSAALASSGDKLAGLRRK